MAKIGDINWYGKSGTKYMYEIYLIGTKFTAVPGNYVFARLDNGTYYAVYAGQTGDLSERFDNHHKMPCIKANKATRICVHSSSSSEKIRLGEESDVIAQWTPTCND
jgi:hypothetical protein